MDLQTLHAQAMDLAEKAMLARARKDQLAAAAFLKQALEKEQHAALLAVTDSAPEPTRSILLKSAAHLALDCGEPRMAERLIGQALAGDPPPEIADELRLLFRAAAPKAGNGHRAQRPSSRAWRRQYPASLARGSKT